MTNTYMQKAIESAHQAGNHEIPVGAVVVKDGKIIASGSNSTNKDHLITSHAELIALRQASILLGDWRLEDCDLYVTLEPCPMCGWAIVQSRIRNLFFGSYDSKYGAFSVAHLEKLTDSKTKIYGGICETECNKLIKEFFQNIRK